MLNKMKVKMGIAASIVALTLAGCGASPKEEYNQAYQELMNAKSYEYHTNISLSIDDDDNVMDPEVAEALDILKTSKVRTHGLVDHEKQQTEQDLSIQASVSPIELSLGFSMFTDLKEQKSYMKAEEFTQLFNDITTLSGFPINLTVPEEMEGSIIELTHTQSNAQLKEKTKGIATNFNDKFMKFVQELPEENFTKHEDVIKLKMDGEQLEPLILEAIEDYLVLTTTPEETKSTIEQLEEQITIGEIVCKTTIDRGQIAKEKIKIPFEIKTDANPVDVILNVETEYKNLNKAVKFSIDLDKHPIVTQEEFTNAITENLFK
jgi:hypothetical protein